MSTQNPQGLFLSPLVLFSEKYLATGGQKDLVFSGAIVPEFKSSLFHLLGEWPGQLNSLISIFSCIKIRIIIVAT